MTQDPLDSILAQASDMDSKAQKLRTSLGYGLDQNPEAAVKAQKVASQLKTTPAYAQGNLPALQKAAALEKFDYDAFIRSSPKTASWASNPNNAAISHDDLEHLASFERAMKDVGSQILQIPQRAMGGLFRAIGGGLELHGAVMEAGQKPGATVFQKILSRALNPRPDINPNQAGFEQGMGKDIRDWYRPLFEDPSMVPETTSGKVAGFTGNIAGTMGKAILAGPMAPFLFGAEAFGEGGGTALERGATPTQAMVKAFGSGGLNTALAIIPGGKFGSEANLAQAFKEGGKWAVTKELGKGVAARAVRGTALGTGVTVAENLLSRSYDPNTPLMEGWSDNVASFLGLEGAGYFTHAIKLASESKLRTRAPEKFRELVSSQLDGSGAETALVSPDRLTVFFQEHNLRPESLGPEVAKNYEEALATGGKVVIPMADLLAAKLDPAHYEALAPDVTFKQDQISPRELQEGLKEMQEAAQKGEGPLADLTKEVDAEAQAAPEFQAIKEELKSRYVAAGESPAVAETYATDMAKVFHVLAQREGMNPSELFAQYAPKIVRGEAPIPADVVRDAFTPETFPAEGVAWQEGDEFLWQARHDAEPVRIDLSNGTSNLGSGDGNAAYQRTGSRLPQGERAEAGRYHAGVGSKIGEAPDLQGTLPKLAPGLPVPSPDQVGVFRAVHGTRGPLEGNRIDLSRASAESIAGPGVYTSSSIERGQHYIDRSGGTGDLLGVDVTLRRPLVLRHTLELTPEQAIALGLPPKSVQGMNLDGQTVLAALRREFKGASLKDHIESLGYDGVDFSTRQEPDSIIRVAYRDEQLSDVRRTPEEVLFQSNHQAGPSKLETMRRPTVEMRDPSFLDYTEEVQNRLDEVREYFPGDEYNPVVYVEDVGIIDGHNRTTVARERGHKIPVVEVPNTVYEHLKGLGYDNMEISFAALDLAAERDAANALVSQFPGSSIERRGNEASWEWREFTKTKPEEALFQSQKNDFSFGSKNWQEYYRGQLGKNARAKGDRANRAMEGMKRAESQEGQAAFDFERNAAAQAEEDAFLRFDKAVSRIQQPRGWFRRTSDGAFEIGKTPEGDFSTFIHEPAHAYLEMFGDLAKREGASEGIKEDAAKVLKFLGVDSWEKIGTPEHELWARANEAYCREGKAPSPELRSVFQRFKVWLQSVYRHVSELDAPLNDDIRGVFDRMRATDAEIEAAHADISGPQIFKTAEEAGMTEREFRSYAIEKGMSMEDAKAEMLAKFNEAAIREKGMEWKREENEVRGAVSDMIDAKPEYRAIRVLRKGALEDGTEFKLDRAALVGQFGEERVRELQKNHPNLYRKEGGMDAEAAAEILGFGSGEEMMQTMEGTPRRSQAIRAEVQRIMTERHGDIRYDGTIEDQARLAVQNDALARGIHREFEALKRRAERPKEETPEVKALRAQVAELEAQGKEQAKDTKFLETQANALLNKNEKLGGGIEARDAKIQALKDRIQEIESGAKEQAKDTREQARAALSVPPLQSFREAAVSLVESKPIRDLDANSYLNNQRKYSREAYKNATKGKYQEAADAKQKELLNHCLYLEAVKGKAEAEKISLYGRKGETNAFQARLGKAGGEYQAQWNALASRYEFAKVTNKELDARSQSLEAWATAQAAAREGIVIDPALYREDQVKNWRELPLTELRAVRDGLKNIETLARAQYEFTLNGKRVEFKDAVQQLNEAARKNLPAKMVPRTGTQFKTTEKASRWVLGSDAYMSKMEWDIDRLDGGDINGPFRRFIKKPIDDGSGREKALGKEIFDKTEAAVKARPKEERLAENDPIGVQIPKMDRPMTKGQQISWVLNLGNKENRNVALLGEGLVNEDGSIRPEAEAVLGKLTSSDCHYIQSLWDAVASLRPHVIERELKKTGVEPKWKEITPFDVHTMDGETIHMEGGYWPLKADHEVSDIGRKQVEPNLEGSFARPTTSRSHTKEVTGATYPLLLDYHQVLGEHLAGVIRDVTMGEAIESVSKIIMAPDVSKAIGETLGPEHEAEFVPWLQAVAGNIKEPPGNVVMRALMSRRSGMVTARLAGNLASYLVQAGDSFKPWTELPAKELLKAHWEIRQDPKRMIEEIRRLSPNEMAFREENFQREIKEMLESKKGLEHAQGAVGRWMFQGFQVMDRIQSFPAWLAKFRIGMAEHGDEGRAVMEADRLIARTMQAGEARNQSRMMREGGLMKLFTTFGGDANTWYGILSSSIHSGNPSRVGVALMALVFEQVASQALRGRLPKKDEDWGTWMVQQSMSALFNPFGFFGDLGDYAVKKATGQFAQLSNPTMQAFEKALSLPSTIRGYAEGKRDLEEVGIDAFDAVGTWTGLPGTGQAVKTWKYSHAVRTGKTQPEDAIDVAKGVAFGPPPKPKK